MKCRLTFYPRLRSEFTDIQELADVINRSRRYVQFRLSGKATFTHREKALILEYLGIETSEINTVFKED